jgi:hypothetical protein
MRGSGVGRPAGWQGVVILAAAFLARPAAAQDADAPARNGPANAAAPAALTVTAPLLQLSASQRAD